MNHVAIKRLRFALIPAAATVLAACASVPTTNAQLDDARAVYKQASSDAVVARSAPVELQRAQQALQASEAALRAGEEQSTVEHHAYLARQQAAVALQAGQIARAEQAVASAQAQRDQILIAARTRDADSRRAEAERARVDADKARRLAEERLAAEQAARQQVAATQTKLSKLQTQLQELQAKQTDRGMVLTLGDVLFDTGRAELKPGALLTIDRLAAFMRDNPERTLMIEGYTDSVGSEEFNLQLSQRRAEAVRMALTGRGIDGARIATRGFGMANPVASNSTPEGRQRNRRIEIVISGAG